MVVPLFFLMLFGFIEFALIGASMSTYNFAAKESARLGSFIGPSSPTADCKMVQLVQQRAAGVVVSKLVQVEIFKSDSQGDYSPPSQGVVEDVWLPSDIASCNVTPPATQPTCPAVTCNWPPSARHDTLLDADYLGVKISFDYTYLTSYISGGASTLHLSAFSVQRIEPQDYQSRHTLPAPMAANQDFGRATLTMYHAGGSGVPSQMAAEVARRRVSGGAL